MRPIETGCVERVSWIPEKFAEVGKVLKIKNDDDEWVDGWVVKSASRDTIDELPDFGKSVRGHRGRTGDSMPKEKK